jgi:hypothetical protein
MSNSVSLTGPAFSLTGDAYFIDGLADFVLTFDSSQDQASVEAFEWYLDGTLIILQNQVAFSGNIACGNHNIGARILTAGGWSGIKTLAFQTCTIPVSAQITGPASVDEGSSADYQVIATLPDNSTLDITGQYTFTCPDGTFAGGTFTAATNTTPGDTRSSTVTATDAVTQPLTKTITIVDTSAAGIVVVDLWDNTTLNVIGFIDNAEVTGNHVAAYTGNNIVPAEAAPASALILASDAIPQTVLNWRFEFNIAELIINYPASPTFVFYIMGRGSVAAALTGAYVLKVSGAQMTLGGTPGSYLPSVQGDDFGSSTNFTTNVVAGANGSYAEADLTNILKLVYTVANAAITNETF